MIYSEYTFTIIFIASVSNFINTFKEKMSKILFFLSFPSSKKSYLQKINNYIVTTAKSRRQRQHR